MRRRVLLVDDEFDLLEIMADLLHAEGYEVFTARNGQRALEVLEREPVDEVVTDLMMPVLSGDELVRRMRADARWREIPVLTTSAGDGVGVARQLGTEFLPKPFDADDLIARVERLGARRSGSNGQS